MIFSFNFVRYDNADNAYTKDMKTPFTQNR